MEDGTLKDIGEACGDERVGKPGKKTKWVYPKKPDHESELDKLLEKINEENKVLRKEFQEKEEKRRDEAFKNAIEGITEAFSGGDPEKARKILEEFVEQEARKIAREINLGRRSDQVGCGRPSRTIFFRMGS